MSQALAGVRVLDLAGGVAGGYCSRLLAELGADVILVEPLGGDECRRLGPFRDGVENPEQSGLFLSLHAGKRSLVADPTASEDRDLLQRLVLAADVVLSAYPPPIDMDALLAAQPRLIHVSVSHFGATGPWRNWQGDEITDYALGGYLQFGGDPEREPLLVPGYQAQHHAGMHAALGALVALAERDRSGSGQAVDVSAIEAMLSAHSWTSVSWSHEGQVLGRSPTDLIRCKDGWVFFMFVNLEGLAVLIERYDLLEDPRFSTVLARMEHRVDLQAVVAEWCVDHTMEEIYRRGQELRVAVTPVHTARDLAASQQLAAREWFRDCSHPRAGAVTLPGSPYRLSATPPVISRPAPLLDEHGAEIRSAGWPGFDGDGPASTADGARASSPAAAHAAAGDSTIVDGASVAPPAWIAPGRRLPLDGLRVIELTANWAGPLAGRYLADLGAEVIKIEAPKRPATRGSHYAGSDGRTRPYNRSGYFNKMNRNKLGLVLDLAAPRGRELFLSLVRRADVVIENNSARVLANLNLAYDVLRREQPGIILCSMSGFGATGPERDYVAYGSNIETICGLAAMMGYHDDPAPHRTGSYYADPVAAAHGAIAVLAALRHRERTGEGQFIDISLLESAAALFGESLMEWSLNGRVSAPLGNRHPRYAPQGCYRCAGNDSWLALTVRDEREWQALCGVIGRDDLAADACLSTADGRREAHDALDQAIAAWSSALDHYEAASKLQAGGVPAAPVLANWELLSDPHLAARGFYVPVPHPEVGVLPFPGMPWRFSRTPGAVRAGAPCFGEHNDFVLRDLLDLSDAEIAALYTQEVTADAPLVALVR